MLEAATPLAQTLGNVLLDNEVLLGRAPAGAGDFKFKFPADWARTTPPRLFGLMACCL